MRGLEDDYKDVLSYEACKRAAEIFKSGTPLDAVNRARLALIESGLPEELRASKAWSEDLAEFKRGSYVRCVYCHQKEEVKRGEDKRGEDKVLWLKEHVKTCKKHPLGEALREIERLNRIIEDVELSVELKGSLNI